MPEAESLSPCRRKSRQFSLNGFLFFCANACENLFPCWSAVMFQAASTPGGTQDILGIGNFVLEFTVVLNPIWSGFCEAVQIAQALLWWSVSQPYAVRFLGLRAPCGSDIGRMKCSRKCVMVINGEFDLLKTFFKELGKDIKMFRENLKCVL